METTSVDSGARAQLAASSKADRFASASTLQAALDVGLDPKAGGYVERLTELALEESDIAVLTAALMRGLPQTVFTQRIASIQAEAVAKAAQRTGAVHVKVSEKGGISVYGIQSRFPITLYREQWRRLLNPKVIDDIGALFSDPRVVRATQDHEAVKAAKAATR